MKKGKNERGMESVSCDSAYLWTLVFLVEKCRHWFIMSVQLCIVREA